jgi:hypothetical protein
MVGPFVRIFSLYNVNIMMMKMKKRRKWIKHVYIFTTKLYCWREREFGSHFGGQENILRRNKKKVD